MSCVIWARFPHRSLLCATGAAGGVVDIAVVVGVGVAVGFVVVAAVVDVVLK